MKLRSLPLLAGLTAAAVGAGVLLATSASAAGLTVNPNSAFNTESKALTFMFAPNANGTPFTPGRTATFTRVGQPSSTFTATITPGMPSGSTTTGTSTVDFRDAGDGLGLDGPIDAGTYAVTTTNAFMQTVDCPSCFVVQADPSLVLTALSPNGVQTGSGATPVTLSGDFFERGTTVEFLVPGTSTVDRGITVTAPADDNATVDVDESAEGITTKTALKRRVAVAPGTATGARDVRVTNLNGKTTTLSRGFFVDGAPLTSTNPPGGNNDPAVRPALTRVVFTGSGLSQTGTPFLQYTAEPGSSTREALTIRGTLVSTPTATTYTADFDLRNAAPARYLPVVRNTDGSSNSCGCTFTVDQAPSRVTTVTSLDSDTATAGTDKSQAVGSTKSFVVTGTGFAKGTRVDVSGAGVTTTAVQLLSDTQLKATFSVAPGTAVGDRNVTATRTDGVASPVCTNCYTVTPAAPSPTPSATQTVDTRPATPTVTVSPSTITASQKSVVSGTGTPGSTIEIFAYSRPNTQYKSVRTGVIDSDGTYAFEVGPSGNTRLYAQSTRGGVTVRNPETVVLSVRTSINLKVVRTGTRTYRFTGSTLPKRRGQLVTVFYENSSGARTIASRARVTEQGTYNVTRTFGGTGTFVLFTGTGRDNDNEANNSNRVRTTIR